MRAVCVEVLAARSTLCVDAASTPSHAVLMLTLKMQTDMRCLRNAESISMTDCHAHSRASSWLTLIRLTLASVRSLILTHVNSLTHTLTRTLTTATWPHTVGTMMAGAPTTTQKWLAQRAPQGQWRTLHDCRVQLLVRRTERGCAYPHYCL